jgi:hypothetical protein
MQIPEDLDMFCDLLVGATSRIGNDYFMLPVPDNDGGEPLTEYRERVYAYELYHQLRSVWPNWRYSLGGEIDKQGHPIVRGPDLNNVKPDLLVHVPGEMRENLLVSEIKASRPDPPRNERSAIETDLKKLAAFCDRAQYQAGILLVFGEEIDRIREHALWAEGRGVRLEQVSLWHHHAPGDGAERVAWR